MDENVRGTRGDRGIRGKDWSLSARLASIEARRAKRRAKVAPGSTGDIRGIKGMTNKELDGLQISTDFMLGDWAADGDDFGNKVASQAKIKRILEKDKDFIDHVEAVNGSKTLEIRNWVSHWSTTSGDHLVISVAFQLMANEMFGGGKIGHYPQTIAAKANQLLKTTEGKAIKAFLKAQYGLTQKYLKENGIKEVLVFRGCGTSGAIKDKNGNRILGERELKLAPLSSTSLVPKEVSYFMGLKNEPSLVVARVPASRVFSMPNTGFGCTGELEVVVLGGKAKGMSIPFESRHDFVGPAAQKKPLGDWKLLESSNGAEFLRGVNERWKEKRILKALKKEIPLSLDEDLEDADWTKMTWDVDIPKYGSVEFNDWLEGKGLTLTWFKHLPLYKFAVKNGLINE